jgi:hypothetical protein
LQEPLGNKVSNLAVSEDHVAFSSCYLHLNAKCFYIWGNLKSTYYLLQELNIDAQFGIESLTKNQNTLLVIYLWLFYLKFNVVTFQNERWETRNTYTSYYDYSSFEEKVLGEKLIMTPDESVQTVEIENCVYVYYQLSPHLIAGCSVGIAISVILLIAMK